jgi:hypothetical protein
VLHREDGPAIESPDGSTFWYREGKMRRQDGPAVEWASVFRGWFLEDCKIFPDELLTQHAAPRP